MPEAEVLAGGEYDEESCILTIDELDATKPFVLVPSTLKEDEEGPFIIKVIVETPGANVTITPVVPVGELVLAAIKTDDLDELEQLLAMAKEQNMRRVHGQRGNTYLKRRRKEEAIAACTDAGHTALANHRPQHAGAPDGGAVVALQSALDGPAQALESALQGAEDAHAKPTLIANGTTLLTKLRAISALEEADAGGGLGLG